MDWAKDGFSATMSTVFMFFESWQNLWSLTLQSQCNDNE